MCTVIWKLSPMIMDLNINAFIRTRFWACPTVIGRGATGIVSPHVVSTPEWLVAVNWVVTRWSWERLLQYWWDVGTLHVTARMGGWTLQINTHLGSTHFPNIPLSQIRSHLPTMYTTDDRDNPSIAVCGNIRVI